MFHDRVHWAAQVRRELQKVRQSTSRGRPLNWAVAAPRHIQLESVRSAMKLKLLYSSVRFLPDGLSKIRPIATVRCARWRSLARLAAQRPPTREPKHTKHKYVSPNRGVLAKALECLGHGLNAQRRLGVATIYTRSHVEEYTEWVDFLRSAIQHREQSVSPSSGRLHVLRVDAARCYDRLKQSRVAQAIRELVPDRMYRTLHFVAVRPSRSRSLHTHVQRSWSLIVGTSDIDSMRLPSIPRHWIVREVSVATTDTTAHVIQGEEMRQVLLQHCQKHLVVCQGRMFVQRNGIVQGSAVANMLCNTVLRDVDECLASVLERYTDDASLLLRRVDDIVVASTSPLAIDECHRVLDRGISSCGYRLNRNKTAKMAGVGLVKWCGVLFDLDTREFSVDWHRYVVSNRLRPTMIGAPTRSTVYVLSLRVLMALLIRTVPTVLCTSLNPTERVLQTLLEVCVLYSNEFVKRIVGAVEGLAQPSLTLFLRPTESAARMLSVHYHRSHHQLRSPQQVVRAVVDGDSSREVPLRLDGAPIRDVVDVLLRFAIAEVVKRRLRLLRAQDSAWPFRWWLMTAAVLWRRYEVANERLPMQHAVRDLDKTSPHPLVQRALSRTILLT